MKTYPALDVHDSSDLTLAIVDDFSPTAVEDRGATLRVFFAASADRDAARAAIQRHFTAAAIDVPDDDWARRSQEGLQPVTIGRLTILPDSPPTAGNGRAAFSIVIRPSMGFGTGHHATTRLCLDALQTLDIAGKRVLDVGTGSGILAIAASRLGASRALGIDTDEDAIHAARENLAYNSAPDGVRFEIADIASMQTLVERVLGRAEIVAANLTGALLMRSARHLVGAAAPGAALVVSGLQVHERDQVVAAFAPCRIVSERPEDEWLALVMKRA